MVGGRRLSFINDLTVTQDGKKVYFTDSSSRWQRRDYLQLIMEATADGRYCLLIRRFLSSLLLLPLFHTKT